MEADCVLVSDSSKLVELSDRCSSVIWTLAKGLSLAAVSMGPAMFAGMWLASSPLVSGSLFLRMTTAVLGLVLSLLFIPYILKLASQDALRQMVVSIAVVSVVIGFCIGVQ
jgi:hypothetical protein